MNRFIIADSGRCIGCRTCEIACVLAHAGDGRVSQLSTTPFSPRLHVIRSATTSTAVMCHQCDDAPCVNACPNQAIGYRDNSVQVDQELCIGCKTCVVACPFGAMEVVVTPSSQIFAGGLARHGVKAEAHKCDLCVGHDGGPACVRVCPTEALHLVDDTSLQETLQSRRQRSALNRLDPVHP